jgi:hypothetical protein
MPARLSKGSPPALSEVAPQRKVVMTSTDPGRQLRTIGDQVDTSYREMLTAAQTFAANAVKYYATSEAPSAGERQRYWDLLTKYERAAHLYQTAWDRWIALQESDTRP